MVLFASYKTTAEPAQVVDIGNVSELTGFARVIRDKPYDAELKLGIQSQDDVRTSNGRIGLRFLDDSVVRLTEHSNLIVDKYVYDSDPSKSKMALQFASGTIRYVSGKINTIRKENITIRTPTATIAIRGTDFTATVDELGRSLIILLPDINGVSSGEIVVSTAMGDVVLNKPYQATTVSVYETTPSKPVVLDITLELIDNMLIVTPPEEDVQAQAGTVVSSNASYLDFNDLDVDFLAEDFLDNEADLEFTELDINYLDTNFLEDLLAVIEELDALTDDSLQTDVSSTVIRGTNLGQDAETQITTIIQGEMLSLRRAVSQSVRIDLDVSQGYTVILIQDGKSNQIIINGGGSSITIKQSSG